MSPVSVVGVSHLTAPVEIRERFAFSPAEAEVTLGRLITTSEVQEAVLLSTCNRTEVYCLIDGETPDFGEWLAQARRMPVETLRRVLYTHRDEKALEHLMRVAGGLDSMVLGEPQILGQLREAYARAHEAGLINGELGRVFHAVVVRSSAGSTTTATSSSRTARRHRRRVSSTSRPLIGPPARRRRPRRHRR